MYINFRGFCLTKKKVTWLLSLLQAVSLVASYLEVPLRYSLRMGGSRSYIRDYAPSIEPPAADSASSVPFSSNSKPIEFPLFLEGQDTTRAAYAVFLLNKVILAALKLYIHLWSLGEVVFYY